MVSASVREEPVREQEALQGEAREVARGNQMLRSGLYSALVWNNTVSPLAVFVNCDQNVVD